MGVGGALTEELVVDKRIGFFVNHDLGSYEVRSMLSNDFELCPYRKLSPVGMT